MTWFAAILVKEMPTSRCTTATLAATPVKMKMNYSLSFPGERPPAHDPADWTVCPPATTLEVPAIDPVVPTETRSDSGLLVGGGGLGWSSVLHLPLTCFWLSLQDRGGYPYRIGEAAPTG